MKTVKIENKSADNITILNGKELLLIDNWILVHFDEDTINGERIIVAVEQLAIPLVESLVYFWMDYLAVAAKAANLQVFELRFHIWSETLEDNFLLEVE